MTKNLINWRELSKELAGNDNSIRKNRIPKKYKSKVGELIGLIDDWKKMINYGN